MFSIICVLTGIVIIIISLLPNSNEVPVWDIIKNSSVKHGDVIQIDSMNMVISYKNSSYLPGIRDDFYNICKVIISNRYRVSVECNLIDLKLTLRVI